MRPFAFPSVPSTQIPLLLCAYSFGMECAVQQGRCSVCGLAPRFQGLRLAGNTAEGDHVALGNGSGMEWGQWGWHGRVMGRICQPGWKVSRVRGCTAPTCAKTKSLVLQCLESA